MNKSVIEVTPKTMFGYALFCVGLFLLVYVAFTCFILANGTVEPLKVKFEENPMSDETATLLGIFVQIGMYGILMFASSILMKVGLSISKT
jgi:hypothetical protein